MKEWEAKVQVWEGRTGDPDDVLPQLGTLMSASSFISDFQRASPPNLWCKKDGFLNPMSVLTVKVILHKF